MAGPRVGLVGGTLEASDSTSAYSSHRSRSDWMHIGSHSDAYSGYKPDTCPFSSYSYTRTNGDIPSNRNIVTRRFTCVNGDTNLYTRTVPHS